jgi:hypothetical protein
VRRSTYTKPDTVTDGHAHAEPHAKPDAGVGGVQQCCWLWRRRFLQHLAYSGLV